jgi:hypothetical protein
MVGIGSFRWVYRRFGSVELDGINDKVTYPSVAANRRHAALADTFVGRK